MDAVVHFLKNLINFKQIRVLLWKDLLIRKRQPWMTFIQFFWPALVFLCMYILRFKYEAENMPACQFPTRQLPTQETVLPFFQSYICTIDNACGDTKHYNETTHFSEAPVTPVLKIVQIFLNDAALFKAIVDLPTSTSFLGAVTTIATSPKFAAIQKHIETIMSRIGDYEKIIGGSFNIKELWSDDSTFSVFGKILCGKPFPVRHDIKFVERSYYEKDYNGPDKKEVDAMPTPYCKQLYLDVTRSNSGKMTWNQVKPVIQGKVLYSPSNNQTDEIMKNANGTYAGIGQFKELISSINTVITKLRTDDTFKGHLTSLLDLAKTPFIQSIISSAHIDFKMIESVLNGLMYDDTVSTVVQTISNIMECFNVDRFIPVTSDRELQSMAFELNDKKLFFGGILFNVSNDESVKNFSYTIRMDVDNTPITLENRNRFWFPGPESSFAMDLRYHRGFIQLQHSIDQGIIKTVKKARFVDEDDKDGKDDKDHSGKKVEEKEYDDYEEEDDEKDNTTTTTTTIKPTKMNHSTTTTHKPKMAKTVNTTTTTTEPSPLLDLILHGIENGDGSPLNVTGDIDDLKGAGLEDFLNFKDEETTTTPTPTTTTATPEHSKNNRSKRSPQFGGLLGLFLGNSNSNSKSKKHELKYNVEDLSYYTKEFPYPAYKKDKFKVGIYLAQAVQMAFFFGLVIQIGSAVRNRIWMRESGNYMLMRVMGLKRSSEYLAWFITTTLELALVFLIVSTILYAGGILETTNKLFLLFFLLTFGSGIIAFSFLMSTFFSSASIGSVSAVIIFLITFLPYIIIVSLGTTLSFTMKFLPNFSISTAFCYAFQVIMRYELQQKEVSFSTAFEGSLYDNDLKFAIFMIFLDIKLYFFIGWVYERFVKQQFRFHKVSIKNMDTSVGASMKNVSMTYDNRPAVDNVSITFRRNYITCLLGRNGAGKSTIIKLLTGQIKPTSGCVYWPQNLDHISGNEIRDKIGLCPQNSVLIPNLTAREHLIMYASIKLKGGCQIEVNKILESLNLGRYENVRVENLSGGFKRRLNVAIAFIGSPNLVILDEPCSAVDSKARRTIWELISVLRKGRAVILATHYLDEAEHLSDNVLIMSEGKIACENNFDTLRDQFSKSFDLKIQLSIADQNKTLEEIKNIIEPHSPNTFELKGQTFVANIPYSRGSNSYNDFGPLIRSIENLQADKRIEYFKILSKDLEGIFNNLNKKIDSENGLTNGSCKNNNNRDIGNGTIGKMSTKPIEITKIGVIRTLFWKRFVHFKRNYKLMACVLILPVVFEMAAMGLMTLRSPDEYDVALKFSEDLYPNSTTFYSLQNENDFDESISGNLHCQENCEKFNSSEVAYRWMLDTFDEYIGRRYGGLSTNQSRQSVWYNNKGYHSMPIWLNKLSTALFRAELNDSSLNIFATNHPLKLGRKELSTSSILQQSADAGISIILMIAFSYVIAGLSVYIVNERINGEKLQQKLCGISFRTYWGVSLVWDLFIYCVALLIAVVILEIYDIPIYTAKENLNGICLLLFMFGFATIPMVHLCEKLFNDASHAAMHILCMNIVIGITTILIITLFDVLGESDTSEQIRNVLNRIFLIFPQHALSEGLVVLCRNHITAEVMERFYINTYKSPVSSDLILPNLIALLLLGLGFLILNYLVETRTIQNLINKMVYKTKESSNELQTIISESMDNPSDDKYDLCKPQDILKVENLSKTYGRNMEALDNVSFQIKRAECFGLLGSNGAGKSTIFSILSGQIHQTSGTVEYLGTNGISYCPQTNALDNLLTVKEIIYFYGILRRISDLDQLTHKTLRAFHLDTYKNVLVKNLSGGNRRKLNVAVTCFGKTNLILMDEPTSDMDPVTRSLVYASINSLIREKRSVILTSHTITEIDRVCQRICVLRDGQLVAQGTPDALKTTFGNSYLITIFFDKIEGLSIERDLQRDIPESEHIMIHNHCLQFTCKIKPIRSDIPSKNDEISEEDTSISLSDLITRLHIFTSQRSIVYTITECLLDQALDRVLESKSNVYSNVAYAHTETVT